ncbi:MAG: DUF5317 domain-containing protein [Rudaea sp.]
MFFLLVVLACLLIALLRGGRPANLAQFDIRFLWLAFVPFVLQLWLFSPLGSPYNEDERLVQLAYFGSMAIAALILLLNRHIPGLTWIAAGLALNLLVISLNGGFMPVSSQAREVAGLGPISGRDNNVVPLTESTLLPFLADIIPIPSWVPLANVLSIGDMVIAAGTFIFTQRALFPAYQGEPFETERESSFSLRAISYGQWLIVSVLFMLVVALYGLLFLILTGRITWHL